MMLLKNPTIIPMEGNMDSFTGAIYSSNGEFIQDSLLYRGKQAPYEKPLTHLSGTYIYGGCLFAHFGHFIWESLSRLYIFRQCKDYPILFISPNNSVFNIYKILFKTIKIKNEIIVIKIPTSVENLIYSQPGSSLNPMYITNTQIQALKCFHFKEKNNDKIWISRSKMKYGKLDNESIIEKELMSFGFKIVYPESLPLHEQVRLISTARIVAGCDGSAFFSVLFSEKTHGNFLIFNRRKNIPSTLSYVFQKKDIPFEQHTSQLLPINETWPIAIFHHPTPKDIVDILAPL